ncbi:PadR family transcriptional regulator [Ornithinimicrobium cryptoxanthini]|uniref:PadR family transcriptional regulator n=1 Tax=Ornithinimicrobium cryptoxanthini TaxID=2934161 RepID=A0ABY4YIG0_9MICO|nr:PadR family transcriptional regulator [Ornithinimicrobium cryptoxanthini]USQ76290.1 PadR family transcriptional regulator [Ornithinimicrobium cryptoxanthini]
MALRFAILGLLLDGPSSGYDLARRFAEVIGAYAWDAKHSQIYPELRGLEEEGLIEVAARGARGRTAYRCTAEGLAELRGWLTTPPESRGGVRNEHALRLFLLPALDHEDAIEVLRHTEAAATAQAERLSQEVLRLQEATGAASGGPLGLTAQYGIGSFRATAQWARSAMDQVAVDARAGRWPGDHPSRR